MQHAPGRLFGADGHATRGAEGEQGDRLTVLQIDELVVVRGDAVAVIAIEIEAEAVEERVDRGLDRYQRLTDYGRNVGIIELEMRT